MDICIDFDGTCVTHEYPYIGKDIGAVPFLKALVGSGHNLILNTMRDKVELDEALRWFEANAIPLYGINRNPTQDEWTSSPKVYGQFYIDDAALGCPLIMNQEYSSRPFVNWVKVGEWLLQNRIIILTDGNGD